MINTFPYPGIKRHLLPHMPAQIDGHFYDLFCGSGFVSYNIGVTKTHTCVDIDPNIISMHQSIKKYDWSAMNKFQSYVLNRWPIQTKDGYYGFRDWFNTTLWQQQHAKTGLGLILLARSCMNGALRLGPNGVNTGSGLRSRQYNETMYTQAHTRSQTIDFICDDFRNIQIKPNSYLYCDPPYGTNPSGSYGTLWKPETLRQMIALCQQHTFWYCDTENKVNLKFLQNQGASLDATLLKEMRSNLSQYKKITTGRKELLITNHRQRSTFKAYVA
jgi:site-specific DNA-adenine methylase